MSFGYKFANKDLQASIQDKQRKINQLLIQYDVGIFAANTEILYSTKYNNPKQLALKSILENEQLREQVNNRRDKNFHQRNYIYEFQDRINILTLKLNDHSKTKNQRDLLHLRDSIFGYIHHIESLYNFYIPTGIIHLCFIYSDNHKVLKAVIDNLNFQKQPLVLQITTYKKVPQEIIVLSTEESLQIDEEIQNNLLHCITINNDKFILSHTYNNILKYDKVTQQWTSDITHVQQLQFNFIKSLESRNAFAKYDSINVERCSTPECVVNKTPKVKPLLSYDDIMMKEFKYTNYISLNMNVNFEYDYDEKNVHSTDELNMFIKMNNYYDKIIDNLHLRYDFGIISSDSNAINISENEIKNRSNEINFKAFNLFKQTLLENFELREMAMELDDECQLLDSEIMQLTIKEAKNIVLLNELCVIEKVVEEETEKMLRYDKFNMNLKYYESDDSVNGSIANDIDEKVDMNIYDEMYEDNIYGTDNMNEMNECVQSQELEDINVKKDCEECVILKEELLKVKSQNEYLETMVNELVENQNGMKQEYQRKINKLRIEKNQQDETEL
eukprot:108642_1